MTTEITPTSGNFLFTGYFPAVVGASGPGSMIFSTVAPTVYIGSLLDPLGRGTCLLASRSIKTPPFAILGMPAERKGT